jgi:hypothetical protein
LSQVRTVSSDITSNNLSSDRDIGIITAILESGNCVELPAKGYSMFPTLIPGYTVILKPLPEGALPEPGSVVVYKDKGILVMHRLLEITGRDKGHLQFITRGDSMMEPDNPWTQDQLLGVAVRYKRVKREHSMRKVVPPACRYKYNHRLLWMFSKIMRMTGK